MAIEIVLPIFIFMMIGIIASRIKYFTISHACSLADYVVKISIPALIITAIGNQHRDDFDGLGVYFILLASIGFIMFFLSMLIAKLIFKLKIGELALFSLTGSASNSGMITMALVLMVLGKEGIKFATLDLVQILLFLITPATVLLEIQKSGKGSILLISKKCFLNIFKNPIIISTFFAVLLSFTNLRVPNFLITSLEAVGLSTLPVALIVIGMDVRFAAFKSHYPQILVSSILKLVIQPIIALSIAYLFNLPPLLLIALLLAAIPPSAKLSVLYSKKYDIYQDVIPGLFAAQNFISMFSISIWILIMSHYYPTFFSTVHSVSL